jgi:hypothetical protein
VPIKFTLRVIVKIINPYFSNVVQNYKIVSLCQNYNVKEFINVEGAVTPNSEIGKIALQSDAGCPVPGQCQTNKDP